MPDTTTGQRFRELVPAIIQEWDDRVRAEVPAAAPQEQVILRDDLELMLEVVAKLLSEETDPKTAARDLAYITLHAEERARQPTYSLEEMIRECHILQEVVIEKFESSAPPPTAPDRIVILQYFNEMVSVAAGEYVRIQREMLQERADRLARMHRSKDEFMAMLGHELRNPLGAISNSLILLREVADPGTLPEHALEIAERQMRHMKRMLDDMLDLSRITEGRVMLRIQAVDLGLAVQQAVEAVRGLLDQRQHTISVSLPNDRIHVKADPVRLGQCLSNLLTNAAKYTNPRGRIEMALERKNNDALVHVRDNGIGIAPDVLSDIFNLFEQAHREMDRSNEGLGIGLAVVRRLVELHGGTVDAKSEGLGKGSEFIMCLPILEEMLEPPAATLPQNTHTSLHILLVEDNADASESMRRVLEKLGHHVTAVGDGSAALGAVIHGCPDVALVDLGLPGMNGYELARKLREGKCPVTMKLVALTGYAEDAEALAAAGFDRHMTKPIDLQQLNDMLDSIKE
jgi:signal transduction histidine kinase